MMNQSETTMTMGALPPLAVSPSEAARLLGIGRTKIYEEIASGCLRSAKIGKRRLITVDAIKDWLAAREAENALEMEEANGR